MKICLIGSTRFKEQYLEANRELSRLGHLVYSVAFITSGSEPTPVSAEEKEILDLVHLRKIQESEIVMLVTDESGYYGDSTRRELLWAALLGKNILDWRNWEDRKAQAIRLQDLIPKPEPLREQGPLDSVGLGSAFVMGQRGEA